MLTWDQFKDFLRTNNSNDTNIEFYIKTSECIYTDDYGPYIYKLETWMDDYSSFCRLSKNYNVEQLVYLKDIIRESNITENQ